MNDRSDTRWARVWWETALHDIRYGFRALRQQPLSNGIIVMTIALVIAALSVLYTKVREERADWFPFPELGRIVSLWRIGEQRTIVIFPPDLFHEYREGVDSLEALGAMRGTGRMTLTGAGEPDDYLSTGVTREVFQILQPRAIRGRLFDDEEYTEDAGNLVIISEQMWREKLDGDTNIIGRDLVFNDKAYEVIGVISAELRTTQLALNVDVWRPLRVERSQQMGHLRLVGKLKPGATVEQAQAELDVLAPRLEAQHVLDEWEKRWGPDGFKTARVVPVTKNVYFAEGIPAQVLFTWVFGGAMLVCVVGIACFNITNLLLARFSARSREIAIRLSLGAGRFRIVRQLLTETALLALLGGALGLLVSFWFSSLLRFQLIDPKMDWRLYLMAFLGALGLGILVGLVPALRSSRKDLNESLKEGGLAVGGRSRHRFRSFLVASEVAMASVLCLVGGLMTRNALEYYRGDLGFRPARLVSVGVQPRRDRGWDPARQLAYLESGLQALREMPGIERASVCVGHYFTRFMPKEAISLSGQSGDAGEQAEVALSRVDPEYPDLLGMPLVGGRRLSETSQPGSGEVLVNEMFVARYFPTTNAIGQQIRFVNEAEWLTIVGVVRDRHHRLSYTVVEPEVFRSFRDSHADLSLLFIAQTRGAATAMAQPIRETLARLDTSQPVRQPEVISDVLAWRAADVRGPMITLALLAGVGLLIALAGVYGVVAFSVVERTREVGIRMAVGATRGEVLRLMLWQGARLMLLGVPPGILIGGLAFSIHRAQSMMKSVSAWDPPTLVCVVLLVGLVGLGASLLPARRSTRIHPVDALRGE